MINQGVYKSQNKTIIKTRDSKAENTINFPITSCDSQPAYLDRYDSNEPDPSWFHLMYRTELLPLIGVALGVLLQL